MNKIYGNSKVNKSFLIERRIYKSIKDFKNKFSTLLDGTSVEIKSEVVLKTNDDQNYVILEYALNSVDDKIIKIFFEVVNPTQESIQIDFLELSNNISREAEKYFIYEFQNENISNSVELKNVSKAIAHLCSYYNRKPKLDNITNSASIFSKYGLEAEVRKRNNIDVSKFRGGTKTVTTYNRLDPIEQPIESLIINVQDTSLPIENKEIKDIEQIQQIQNEIVTTINNNPSDERVITLNDQGNIELPKQEEDIVQVVAAEVNKEIESTDKIAEEEIVKEILDEDGTVSFKVILKKSPDSPYYVSNIKEPGDVFFSKFGDPYPDIPNDLNKIKSNISRLNNVRLNTTTKDFSEELAQPLTPTLQNPNMYTTKEQLMVRNISGNTIINAYAGAGKTASLIEYCLAHPNEKKMYLVYSSGLQSEMAHKVKQYNIQNLACLGTIMVSRAMMVALSGSSYFKIKSNYEINWQNYISYPLSYNTWNISKGTEDRFKNARSILAFIIELYDSVFCTEEESDPTQLNYYNFIKSEVDSQFYLDNETKIKSIMDSIYKKMISSLKSGQDISWNFVTKYASVLSQNDPYFLKTSFTHKNFSYVLPDPKAFGKGIDTILLDEAQDTSAAVFKILTSQKGLKLIVVGDAHQNIFGFMNTKNVLTKFNFQTLSLSNSFRYNQEIANLGMAILDNKAFLGQDTSNIQINGRSEKKEGNSYAYLCRTNIAVFKEVFYGISGKDDKGNPTRPVDVLYLEGDKEETTGGFDKVFLNMVPGFPTIPLFYFYKEYLVNKAIELDNLKKAGIEPDSKWYDDFDNKWIFSKPYYKDVPALLNKNDERYKYFFINSQKGLMRYAQETRNVSLSLMIGVFEDKLFKDMGIDTFLYDVETIKSKQIVKKLDYFDSIKNNSHLKHGIFTTIHKSKGLEYDYVIMGNDVKLPEMPTKYKTNSKGFVLFDEDQNPIPVPSAIYEKSVAEFGEELNTIYVGVTRAKVGISHNLKIPGFPDSINIRLKLPESINSSKLLNYKSLYL